MYSTVPPWLRPGPSLIDALTGAPGMAFPPIRLGSGIASGRDTGPFQHTGPSLGIFPETRVFVAAFVSKNLAHFFWKVNPPEGKKLCRKRTNGVATGTVGGHNLPETKSYKR